MMRVKIIIIGLVCLGILACGVPMKTKTYLYPNPPETLYSQMIPVLLELDFEIIHTDKISRVIIAGKSKTMAYHKVTINFTEQDNETTVLVQVVLPGKSGSDSLGWCEKTANEIMEKFEERIKR